MSESDGENDRTASGQSSAGSASQSRNWRKGLITTAQWAVALGAFWYVARDIAWQATLTELGMLGPLVIVAVLVITTLEFGSRFSMWYVLLNGRKQTSFTTTARIDLVIKFVNHVVPSKASGHSVAPLVLRYYTDTDWTEAVSIAGLNTGLYTSLYGLVALGGLAVFTPQLTGGWLVIILFSTGVYLAAGGLILLAGRHTSLIVWLANRLGELFNRIPRFDDRLVGVTDRLPSFTDDSARIFRRLSSRPSILVTYALGWAGTLMIFPALRVWLVLTALGGGFSHPLLLPVILVMAYSVTVLPLTPGGVGVAEASATAVLVSLGMTPELAPIVVLTDRLFGVYLPALMGWLPAASIDVSHLLTRRDEQR